MNFIHAFRRLGFRIILSIGLIGALIGLPPPDASAARRGVLLIPRNPLHGCAVQPGQLLSNVQALCANSDQMRRRHREIKETVETANPEFYKKRLVESDAEKENTNQEEEIVEYCSRLTSSEKVAQKSYLDHIPSTFIEALCAASPAAGSVANAVEVYHTRKPAADHSEHQPCLRPEKAHPASASHIHRLMDAPHHLLGAHPPMERFQPALDSYLALIEKQGRRPDFRPSVPNFEKARLEELDGLIPEFKIGGPRPSPEDFAPYYEAFLKSLPKGTFQGVAAEDLALVPPKTAPGSGAFVFLIKNKKTGQVIAALKIQDAERGLDEILSVTAAEAMIKERSPKTHLVKTIAAGKIVEPHSSHPKPEKSSYFIIQTAAQGADLTSYMRAIGKAENGARRAAIDKANAATRVVAHTLATLHKDMRHGKDVSPATISRFQQNAEFESDRLRRGLLGSVDTLGSLKSGVAKGELTPELAQRIERKVDALDKAYIKLTKERPDLIALTDNHGDFHGGNAFVAEKPDGTFHSKGELIDYGTLAWNLGKKNETGSGDPAADAGRMSAALMTAALQNASPVREAIHHAKVFLDSYKQAAGFNKGSLEEKAFDLSVQFHMNRLFNLESSDPNKKFKSTRVPPADLRRSLYFLIDDVFDADYKKLEMMLTQPVEKPAPVQRAPESPSRQKH